MVWSKQLLGARLSRLCSQDKTGNGEGGSVASDVKGILFFDGVIRQSVADGARNTDYILVVRVSPRKRLSRPQGTALCPRACPCCRCLRR